MMGSLKIWIAALGALTALGAPALAASTGPVATPHVRAELVASADAVRPGDRILVGVHKRIIPHWHTYWKNPGDSGQATTIAWALPAGAAAGDILWPMPRRFRLGPVVNYGYETEVTLLTEITVPDTAPPAGTFPIRATVDWLVCEEICVPEQVMLGLDLPVAAAGTTPGPGSQLIDAARAQLPVASPWPAGFERRGGALALTVKAGVPDAGRIQDLYFYPADWGVIDHAAAQRLSIADGTLVLALAPGENLTSDRDRLGGVLVLTERTADGAVARAFSIDAPIGAMAGGAVSGGALAAPAIGLGAALLFALLGGLILNLMPCVFPVLSFKALALVAHARAAPVQVRLHGAAYAAGVLASFAALAAVLVALKAGGAEIGWGFQFQSPAFVLLLAWLMFAVGLLLSGVFTLGASVADVGGALAARPGYAGSFFTGVLAAVVATPCTAPFMGAAIGFASAQPTGILFAVFLALGLGLALPYLLLSAWPPLLRLLPRPGPWMERLKQVLAFPMYGTAVWLVWVLAQQTGANAVAAALAGMVLIAFGAWLFDSTRQSAPAGRRAGSAVAALVACAVVAGGFLAADRTSAPAAGRQVADGGGALASEPYSEARLAALRAERRPVFLNFTAAWCITCLVNERMALNESAVADAFQRGRVAYLKGDWTNQDKAITAKLKEFGRSGVPLYVYYPAGANAAPVVLPQILTADIVLREIGAARTAAAASTN